MLRTARGFWGRIMDMPRVTIVIVGLFVVLSSIRGVRLDSRRRPARKAIPYGSAAFSPDGNSLAIASRDGRLFLLDAIGNHGQLLFDGDFITQMAFSRDGKTLASGSSERGVRLWNLRTRNEGVTCSDIQWVSSIAFSPDGQTLAVGSWEQGVSIRDPKSGTEKATLSNPRTVTSLAFSVDGHFLVVGSAMVDGSANLTVWDVLTQHRAKSISGIPPVSCVAFCPRGEFLATGHWDYSIRLWQVGTWRESATFRHEEQGSPSRLTPGGKMAQAGRPNGSVVGGATVLSEDRPYILWGNDPSCPRLGTGDR